MRDELISEQCLLFRETGRRQTEDFGLDLRRIDIVEIAVVLPELRGFRRQRIHDDEVLQLRQPEADLRLVRRGGERIEALTDVAVLLLAAISSKTCSMS